MTLQELVSAQFPGKLLIPMVEAGASIGLAEQSCYNLKSRGAFPLPVSKIGNKPMVAITDLIAFLEGLAAPVSEPVVVVDTEPKPTTKRRPGRPTKAEQIARRRQLS